MKVRTLDISNYFKSIILLIGKNRIIPNDDRILLLDICKILNMDQEICSRKIDNSYDNEYIINAPPQFSSKIIAESMLKDGIRIAFADKKVHLYELEWLRSIASENNISDWWLSEEIGSFLNSNDSWDKQNFEIQKYFKNYNK
jgi:hypothetical protein